MTEKRPDKRLSLEELQNFEWVRLVHTPIQLVKKRKKFTFTGD